VPVKEETRHKQYDEMGRYTVSIVSQKGTATRRSLFYWNIFPEKPTRLSILIPGSDILISHGEKEQIICK
jgi:hypothetical protein